METLGETFVNIADSALFTLRFGKLSYICLFIPVG